MLAKVARFLLQTAITARQLFCPTATMADAVQQSQRRALISTSPPRIVVHVVPRDFERKGFVGEIVAAVTSLAPGVSLVLELTERFLLSSQRVDLSCVYPSVDAGGGFTHYCAGQKKG